MTAEAGRGHWAEGPTKVLGLATGTLALVSALLGLVTQLGGFGNVRIPFLPGVAKDPEISLSAGQGSSGSHLRISGSHFAGGEKVALRFHVEELGSARADKEGAFVREVTVPGTEDAFAPMNITITATGTSTDRSATAVFRLLAGGRLGSGPATLRLSDGRGPSGTRVTVTGENFSPGEEVEVRFDATRIGTALADARGRVSVRVTIPGDYDAFGSAQRSIIATGRTSIKSVERPFALVVQGG